MCVATLAAISREIVLRDGTSMHLRALRPADRPEVLAMLKRCSLQTLRFRFLRIIKEITDKLLDELPPMDGVRHLALVVTPLTEGDQRICAVGRYIADQQRPGVAEVSFLVEDAMQRRGIGTILLDALAALARQHDIHHFSADVLGDNWLMLSVFRDAGYELHSSTSCGVTHLEFPIVKRIS